MKIKLKYNNTYSDEIYFVHDATERFILPIPNLNKKEPGDFKELIFGPIDDYIVLDEEIIKVFALMGVQ